MTCAVRWFLLGIPVSFTNKTDLCTFLYLLCNILNFYTSVIRSNYCHVCVVFMSVIQMFYSGFFTFCVLLSLYILFFYASVMYDCLYLCVLVTSNPFCSPDIPSNACHSFVVYNLYNSYYIIEYYNVIIHHNYD